MPIARPIARTEAAPVYADMEEPELVAHACRGESDAFGVIMQRCNQPLFRVARAIVSDDSEAEDVVQESYFKAFKALATFRGDSSLSTWLTRITINEARGRLRSRKKTVNLAEVEVAQKEGSLVIPFRGAYVMENPEAEVARSQIRTLIENAVDELPEPFRLVFVLRDIQDYSVDETAASLGIKPETVKTRLHRARRQLRVQLNEVFSSTMQDAFPFLGERCERINQRVLTMLSERRICPESDFRS
ncbi:RNA polymerase sigma factor [Parvibaculum sp.]|uniref:RNA polymerase sigma factor n=1 Tax=Parvibaculum sp. TaxID=2024848 RepID=UPI001DFB37F1|nr:RNA polymerase sigma factor [Parvibaculum sp.]MBX3488691.1 RNA polymerase sigma factor [Parvibaculum sp.]MCW5727427.1 RNA polymerase sigma factor [Parvibaculum sp.]